MEKKTFEQYKQCAKDTFTSFGVKTDTIDYVVAMQGADISHMLSTWQVRSVTCALYMIL